MSYLGKKPRYFSVHLHDDADTLTNFADKASLYSSRGLPWLFSADGRLIPLSMNGGAYTRNYVTRPFSIGQTLDATPAGWTVSGAALAAKCKPTSTDLRISGGDYQLAITASAGAESFQIPLITIDDPVDIESEFCVSFEYIRTAGSWSSGDLTVWVYNGSTLQPVSPIQLLDSTTPGTFVGRVQSYGGAAPTKLYIYVANAGVTATLKITNINVSPSSGMELATVGAVSESSFSGFVEWYGTGDHYAISTTTNPNDSITVKRGGRGRILGTPVSWDGNSGNDKSVLTAGKSYLVGYSDDRTPIAIDVSTLYSADRKATHDNLVAAYKDNVILFEAWYDGADIHVSKENHPYGYPIEVGIDTHIRTGTVYTYSGAVLTLEHAANAQIRIEGEDCLSDHGLESRVYDSAPGSALPATMVYQNAGGAGAIETPGTALLGKYASAGVSTNITAGQFSVLAIYLTKDDLQKDYRAYPFVSGTATPRCWALMSNSQYATAVAAATSIGAGDVPDMTQFTMPSQLLALEPAIIGFVIVTGDGAGAADITAITSNGFVAGIRPFKASTSSVFSAGAVNVANAVNVALSVSNFDKVLAADPTDAQSAFDIIDECLGSGTDNRLMRYDIGASTKAQSTGITCDDSDNVSGALSLGFVTGGTAASTKLTLSGTTWQFGLDTTVKSSITEAGAFSGVTGVFATSVTSPIIYGGSGNGDDLTLESTSGTKSGSLINFGASGAAGQIDRNLNTWTIGDGAATKPTTTLPEAAGRHWIMGAAPQLTLYNTAAQGAGNAAYFKVGCNTAATAADTMSFVQMKAVLNSASAYGAKMVLSTTDASNNLVDGIEISSAGAVTIGEAQAHTLGGNLYLSAVAGGSIAAEATYSHVGTKLSNVMFNSGACRIRAGMYYSGDHKHSTANYAGSEAVCRYASSSSETAFEINSSQSYSHSADSTATQYKIFNITHAGAVTIAPTGHTGQHVANGTLKLEQGDADSYAIELRGSSATALCRIIGGGAAGDSNYVELAFCGSSTDGNRELQIRDSGTAIVSFFGDGKTTFNSAGTYGRDVASLSPRAAYLGNGGEFGYSSSSRRFKINEEAAPEYDLLSIQPTLYNRKDRPDGEKELGLIAEDVEKVCPYLVFRDMDGAVTGIHYEKVAVALLSTIRSLKARIEALESK